MPGWRGLASTLTARSGAIAQKVAEAETSVGEDDVAHEAVSIRAGVYPSLEEEPPNGGNTSFNSFNQTVSSRHTSAQINMSRELYKKERLTCACA